MERVLLTGATGFIGRVLAARLAGEGYAVRAVSRQAGATVAGAAETAIIPGDPADPAAWRPVLAGIDHVVHAAGIAHATAAIPEAAYRAANAAMPGALARAAASATGGRFVLLSSIRAVTGPVAAAPVRDDAPAVPTDAYGRSKLEGERAVAAAFAEAPGRHAVLRPVLVYGPDAKGNLAALARLAALPVPLPLAGLAGRRSLLDVDALADAVPLLLRVPRLPPGPFVVADRAPVTVAGIVAALRAARGRPARLFALPERLLALPFRLTGRGAAWERLSGSLVAQADGLAALGWTPPGDTLVRLARHAREPAAAAD